MLSPRSSYLPLEMAEFGAWVIIKNLRIKLLYDGAMPQRDRFVRGMVSWVWFKQFALPYRRAERFAGESKYPLRKMLRFTTDGLLSVSTKTLQMSVAMGLICASLARLFVRLIIRQIKFDDIKCAFAGVNGIWVAAAAMAFPAGYACRIEHGY